MLANMANPISNDATLVISTGRRTEVRKSTIGATALASKVDVTSHDASSALTPRIPGKSGRSGITNVCINATTVPLRPGLLWRRRMGVWLSNGWSAASVAFGCGRFYRRGERSFTSTRKLRFALTNKAFLLFAISRLHRRKPIAGMGDDGLSLVIPCSGGVAHTRKVQSARSATADPSGPRSDTQNPHRIPRPRWPHNIDETGTTETTGWKTKYGPYISTSLITLRNAHIGN
jgi:hypothetical protein